MNLGKTLVTGGLLFICSSCSQKSSPLVDLGNLARQLHQCEAAQELPHECDTALEAMRNAKLDALGAGYKEADIEAALHIATQNLIGSIEKSPYYQVQHLFSMAAVPVVPMASAFQLFSRKHTCSEAGSALLLRDKSTRDDFDSYFSGPISVFVFEPVSKYKVGHENQQPCLSADNFPNGTIVVSAEQFEELQKRTEIDGKRAAFELKGEYEAKMLREGQRKSRINAEMSRLESLHPDKYRCRPEPGRRYCYGLERQLREAAMLSLGLITETDIKAEHEKAPKGLGGLMLNNKNWCWNAQRPDRDPKKNSIWLSLSVQEGHISGRHCISDPRGRDVDCVDLHESTPTIIGDWEKDAFVVRVTSVTGGQVGEARISTVSLGVAFNFTWTQTKPAGPFFPLGTVVFSECKSQ